MSCESLLFSGCSYRGYYTAYAFAFTDTSLTPTDVTGWDFALTLYRTSGGKPAGGPAVKAFTVGGGQVTVGTTDGRISVEFPAAEALALAAGSYWAEARATDSLGLLRLVGTDPDWVHHETGLGGSS